jgi:hypothetical protein
MCSCGLWAQVAEFPGVTKEEVGTLSGIIAAGFGCGQFISNYWWFVVCGGCESSGSLSRLIDGWGLRLIRGLASDRFGSKPVVLTSLFSTMLASIWFGFSRSVLSLRAGVSLGYVTLGLCDRLQRL